MTNEIGQDISKVEESQIAGLKRMFTSKQLSELLLVSESHLANERWKRAGIPFVKIGGSVRYRESDIMAYIEENMVQTIN
jgi:hypothetical protein